MNSTSIRPEPHPDPQAAAYQLMLMLAALGADPGNTTPIHALADTLWMFADPIAHRYVHQLYADVADNWPDRQAIAQANTRTAERFTRIYQHHHRDTHVEMTPQ